jgi:collagenase-like PrtC family protease
MKIACPLSDTGEILPLVAAGAHEFYCGFVPDYWREHYAEFGFLNRREGPYGHFTSLNSLRSAVELVHDNGKRLFVALNGLYFLDHQYELLKRIVHDVESAGADGVIAAEIGLLGLLEKMKYSGSVHAGSGFNVFNCEAAAFLQERGVRRIILPRDFTAKELTDLALSCGELELEAFVLNTRCRQVDGLCNWYHGFLKEARIETRPKKRIAVTTYDGGYQSHMCRKDFEFCKLGEPPGDEAEGAHAVQCLEKACGVCRLPELAQSGVEYVKIVGRGAPLQDKEEDVRFVKACIDLIPHTPPDEYMERARSFYNRRCGRSCTSVNCYYPA